MWGKYPRLGTNYTEVWKGTVTGAYICLGSTCSCQPQWKPHHPQGTKECTQTVCLRSGGKQALDLGNSAQNPHSIKGKCSEDQIVSK